MCRRAASPLNDSMTSTPASAECIVATPAAAAAAAAAAADDATGGRRQVTKALASVNSVQKKSYLAWLQVCLCGCFSVNNV